MKKKCYFLPFTYKPGDKRSVHIKSTTDRKHRTKIHNSWLKRGKCKKKIKKKIKPKSGYGNRFNYLLTEILWERISEKKHCSEEHQFIPMQRYEKVWYLGGTVSLVLNFSILGGLSPSPVALLHKSIASRQLAYSRKDM